MVKVGSTKILSKRLRMRNLRRIEGLICKALRRRDRYTQCSQHAFESKSSIVFLPTAGALKYRKWMSHVKHICDCAEAANAINVSVVALKPRPSDFGYPVCVWHVVSRTQQSVQSHDDNSETQYCTRGSDYSIHSWPPKSNQACLMNLHIRPAVVKIYMPSFWVGRFPVNQKF